MPHVRQRVRHAFRFSNESSSRVSEGGTRATPGHVRAGCARADNARSASARPTDFDIFDYPHVAEQQRRRRRPRYPPRCIRFKTRALHGRRAVTPHTLLRPLRRFARLAVDSRARADSYQAEITIAAIISDNSPPRNPSRSERIRGARLNSFVYKLSQIDIARRTNCASKRNRVERRCGLFILFF